MIKESSKNITYETRDSWYNTITVIPTNIRNSHVNTALWLDSSCSIHHSVLVWRCAQHWQRRKNTDYFNHLGSKLNTIKHILWTPLLTHLWTWERTHRDCRGWAPACETSAHLRRRWAQWGTRTREGFLPPAQAVGAAAALAPAELYPFPVHGLPGPPHPSLYKLSSCVNTL